MSYACFFRPSYELATNYLYEWFGLGVEYARRLGYRVVDIAGEDATPGNLLEALNTYAFSALFLGGHGNPDTFTGQNGAIILKACQNDEVLSGNLAYLLSCYTGQELGPSMIGKDVTAYVGYQNDFRFMVDTTYPILDDPLAEPFRDIAFEIVARILLGQRISDVYNGGFAKCDEWIARLMTRPEKVWGDVISFVRHDRDGLIALGRTEAYSTRPITLAPLIPLGSMALGSLLMFIR